MRWLIEDTQLIRRPGMAVERTDLLVEGDRIATIGKDLHQTVGELDEVISGNGHLVVPGLVNAHLHSHDRFDKGRFGTMPLEVWISLYNPPTLSRAWTPRECYLRTILSGIDLLRSGTTTVIDDVHHGLPANPDNIEAVFQAYDDLGIRALISVAHSDKAFWDGIPFLAELLPDDLKSRRDDFSPPDNAWVLSCWRELARKWSGRVSFALSPSGPQRCSDEFLCQTWAMSEEIDRPVIIHVLETQIQKFSGTHFYGKSIVEKMSELGLLTRRSNLIHGVWMSDTDLDLVADNNACIVHCPVSNLKLGSGIAPVAKMLARGIPVGIGTDNHNANDSANLFESIKLSALLAAVREDQPDNWLDARDVLQAATWGGARCALLDDVVGELKPGMKADFLVLDTASTAFLPANDFENQLVYCENGSSVIRVVVDGQTVFHEGRCTAINELELMDELRDSMPAISEKISSTAYAGRELQPWLQKAYEQCFKELQ